MENYNDIEQYIQSLIQSCGSLDVAEAEFKRLMVEDPDLQESYRNWCDESGYSTRNGFSEYADEYMEGRESIWNSLNDYDDEDI